MFSTNMNIAYWNLGINGMKNLTAINLVLEVDDFIDCCYLWDGEKGKSVLAFWFNMREHYLGMIDSRKVTYQVLHMIVLP